MESGPLPAVTAVTVTSAGEGDASGAAVGAAVATEASAGADEAGAWELLKRRVAENRKLSTENRRLRNELGDQQVRARLCRCRRVAADRALLPRTARDAGQRAAATRSAAAERPAAARPHGAAGCPRAHHRSVLRSHSCADSRHSLGTGQDAQRAEAQSTQGRTQADVEEFEGIVAELSREKQQMESTVLELMLRLEAASKHTQALADERTFLKVCARTFCKAPQHPSPYRLSFFAVSVARRRPSHARKPRRREALRSNGQTHPKHGVDDMGWP